MWNYSRKQLIAAGIIVSIIIISTAVYFVKINSISNNDIKFIEPSAANTASQPEPLLNLPADNPEPLTICVHVAGKVKLPGVYDLQPDCRVKDAVKAAGGALPNTDLDSINLAQKVEDGMQIYISSKGVIPPPAKSVVRGGASVHNKMQSNVESSSGSESEGSAKLSSPGEGTVNINSAGLDELQRLPGIGPAMAQRIIDYRSENGKFNAVDELDEVKGIGPSKLEKMRPFVVL
ncbi:MAG: helix-hairpin-helix domain-containing protein [Armatimonadota bacterium]